MRRVFLIALIVCTTACGSVASKTGTGGSTGNAGTSGTGGGGQAGSSGQGTGTGGTAGIDAGIDGLRACVVGTSMVGACTL